MREIKFRTWNRKLKEMFYKNDISIFTDKNGNLVSYVLSDGERVYETIMQYTGIKDKNGTEIYESDLIQFSDWKPKEVIYEGGDGLAGFRLKDTDLFMMGFESKEYEVVGNVYESKKGEDEAL